MTAEFSSAAIYRAKLEGFDEYRRAPEEHWWFHRRELPDGRVLYLHPMLGGNIRISISPDAESMGFDQTYCYHDSDAAWRAALGWDGDGDPEGWYRHHQTARRRPDGTSESEYIAE